MSLLCWEAQKRTQCSKCVSPGLSRRAGWSPLTCWQCPFLCTPGHHWLSWPQGQNIQVFFYSDAVQSIYQRAVRCHPNQNLAKSYHQISRCSCLLCVKHSGKRGNILVYFIHKNVWILHEEAKGLVAIQWIIFHLLKCTPYCLLKILTSGVKQAIWFQSNAVIKTTAGGHLEHNGTASLIVTEM